MRKLHEPIVSELIGSIASGAYAPGDVLPNETGLARSRCVSRTAAREAMQKPQALGQVEVKRHRATTVQPRSAWNVLDPAVHDAAAVHLHDLAFFDALMEARLRGAHRDDMAFRNHAPRSRSARTTRCAKPHELNTRHHTTPRNSTETSCANFARKPGSAATTRTASSTARG